LTWTSPRKGQVQLFQGYEKKPLSAILCSCVCSAGVNSCLYPKKLPCQDFLCLLCVCFQHWRIFNSNKGKTPNLLQVERSGTHYHTARSIDCHLNYLSKEDHFQLTLHLPKAAEFNTLHCHSMVTKQTLKQQPERIEIHKSGTKLVYSHCEVPRTAASTSSGIMMEMQISGPHSKSSESEILGVVPIYL
jgi:hypothetical protein